MVEKIFGRKKKLNKEFGMTSFYLPESFKGVWNKLNILVEKDFNEDFKTYCKEIEGIQDLDSKGQSKRGIYIRWILWKHVIQSEEIINSGAI